MNIRRNIAKLCAIGSLAIAGAAHASTLVLAGGAGSGSDGNSLTFSDGTTSVQATAWAVDYDSNLEDGALGQWSYGLGVNNSGGDGSHTVDNVGWTDFILLQFSSSVVLESATFATGWHGMNDTDATIGAMNALGAWNVAPLWDEQPDSILSGFSFWESGSVGQSGWDTRNINPGSVAGNWWIIGASSSNPDNYGDGFKLKSITFSSAVPEPSTWLMLILGFGLVGGVMRRESRKVRLAYS